MQSWSKGGFDSHTTTKIINNMKQIIKLMSVYYYTILIVAITVLVMNKSNEQEVINTSENMIEWIMSLTYSKTRLI